MKMLLLLIAIALTTLNTACTDNSSEGLSVLKDLEIRRIAQPEEFGDMSDMIWSEITGGYIGFSTGKPQTNDYIFQSPDGVEWEILPQPFGAYLVYIADCKLLNGVAAISYSKEFYLSKDGNSWDMLSELDDFLASDFVCTSRNVVVVGHTHEGEPVVSTSTNGSDWNTQTISGFGALTAVSEFPNGLIAVGSDGTIITSDDEESWTLQQSEVIEELKDIAVGDDTMVSVGTSGVITASTDMTGLNWLDRTPSEGRLHWEKIVWTGTHFVFASNYAEYLVATVDGSSLDILHLEWDTLFYTLAAHNGQVVLAGSAGQIFSTPPLF